MIELGVAVYDLDKRELTLEPADGGTDACFVDIARDQIDPLVSNASWEYTEPWRQIDAGLIVAYIRRTT